MKREVSGLFGRTVLLASVLVPALSFAQSPPYGKQVGSGTLTAANPRITFSDGPFVMPNVTGLESLLGLVGLGVSTPTCTSTPTLPGGALSTSQCDFFNLTVSAPTLAATHDVQVAVSWPDPNNPTDQSEFDLFVYDSSNNPIAVANAGVASPRVVNLQVPALSGNYTVQVVPFNPEGFTYTATIALVAKPTFTVPPPNPLAARFQTYLSPAGLGENAAEPSIGVDWNPNVASLKHGTVNQGGVTFYQSGPNTLRVSFDDCSSPAGHLWEDVSTPLVQQFVLSDPIGFVDSTTGRVFSMDLIGGEGNSFLAFSDDDGNSWTPAQGGGIPGGPDHETLGGGAYHTPLPNPNPVYAHAIYYAAQDIAPEAQCSRSDDGGVTFGAGVPIYQTPQCAGNASIHGHVKVGPDGTVYIASGSCAAGPGVAISRDNGITWSFAGPPNQSDYQFLDPSVAIDAANNVYLIWLDGNTNHPYVSVSKDGAGTWSAPFDVGAAFGIQNADFVISTAGDAGRAAVGFVGATQTGNPQSAAFPGIWNLYLATTYDTGSTWTTLNARRPRAARLHLDLRRQQPVQESPRLQRHAPRRAGAHRGRVREGVPRLRELLARDRGGARRAVSGVGRREGRDRASVGRHAALRGVRPARAGGAREPAARRRDDRPADRPRPPRVGGSRQRRLADHRVQHLPRDRFRRGGDLRAHLRLEHEVRGFERRRRHGLLLLRYRHERRRHERTLRRGEVGGARRQQPERVRPTGDHGRERSLRRPERLARERADGHHRGLRRRAISVAGGDFLDRLHSPGVEPEPAPRAPGERGVEGLVQRERRQGHAFGLSSSRRTRTTRRGRSGSSATATPAATPIMAKETRA
jgi:hypothetical protein